jgi:hypothetical protein
VSNIKNSATNLTGVTAANAATFATLSTNSRNNSMNVPMDTCSVWARVRARFRAFGHGIDPRIKDLDGETAVDSTCHTSEVRAATQDMF